MRRPAAPPVVPGFSAPGEIWRDVAELLKPSVTLHSPALSYEEKIIAPKMVAAALERLYLDPELRIQRAREAYAVVIRTLAMLRTTWPAADGFFWRRHSVWPRGQRRVSTEPTVTPRSF